MKSMCIPCQFGGKDVDPMSCALSCIVTQANYMLNIYKCNTYAGGMGAVEFVWYFSNSVMQK
jgi:hypothetical protein